MICGKMCGKKWSRAVCTAVFALGLVSFLVGLLTFLVGKPEGETLNTFLGMLTGFGFGIMAVAVWSTVRRKVVSKEKLAQEDIDREDERNVAVTRAACTAVFYVSVLLMAALVFLFMGLGYRTPSYICLGAMYVLVLAFFVARRVVDKRM